MTSHRLAEAVADRLRERIFSGELSEGAMLPKQDALCREFNVGLVTVREALRMLEVEGLVTVKRGNLGGSIVHRPETWRIAYMIALSLQSRSVTLADVLATLRLLEPLSAAACAQRADRAETVVPHLRAVVDEQRAALDNGDLFIALAVKFHVGMAQHCGIETLGLMLGALENIWSAQIDRLARHTARHGAFGDRDVRVSALADHERMVEAIAAGDVAMAERMAREHMSESHHQPARWTHDFDMGVEVDASYLRQ